MIKINGNILLAVFLSHCNKKAPHIVLKICFVFMTKACHLVGMLKQVVENRWPVSQKQVLKDVFSFTGLPGFMNQFQ